MPCGAMASGKCWIPIQATQTYIGLQVSQVTPSYIGHCRFLTIYVGQIRINQLFIGQVNQVNQGILVFRRSDLIGQLGKNRISIVYIGRVYIIKSHFSQLQPSHSNYSSLVSKSTNCRTRKKDPNNVDRCLGLEGVWPSFRPFLCSCEWVPLSWIWWYNVYQTCKTSSVNSMNREIF